MLDVERAHILQTVRQVHALCSTNRIVFHRFRIGPDRLALEVPDDVVSLDQRYTLSPISDIRPGPRPSLYLPPLVLVLLVPVRSIHPRNSADRETEERTDFSCVLSTPLSGLLLRRSYIAASLLGDLGYGIEQSVGGSDILPCGKGVKLGRGR